MSKITNEQLSIAVQETKSLAATMRFLSLRISGSNYKVFGQRIALLKLDTSHWERYNVKAAHQATKIPIEQILVKDSAYNDTHKLKKRLIRMGILKNECAQCSLLIWQGEELSLHLDHINGIRNDNCLENLRLLCPNCHSLTPTYCGKNNRRYDLCIDCNNRKESKTSRRCASCLKLWRQTQAKQRSIENTGRKRPKLSYPG